jgi:predicted acetyltransferase
MRSLWRDRQAVRRLSVARLAAARTAQSGQSWYLALLGTDPRFRQRGVATQLLEHTLARCDADGLPTWLETTSPANVAFYQRHGYAQVAAIRGGAVVPDLWVMRREPRPTGAGSA